VKSIRPEYLETKTKREKEKYISLYLKTGGVEFSIFIYPSPCIHHSPTDTSQFINSERETFES